MSKTLSLPGEIGMQMPDFDLVDCTGIRHTADTVTGPSGTLVLFLCNHCPYVKHIAPELPSLATDLARSGIRTVAINPNDPTDHPEDTPDGMLRASDEYKFTFPYLIDDTGDTARAFNAVCTPDIYLFTSRGTLYYRGQLDNSRPGNYELVTGESLLSAAALMVTLQPAPAEQKPSLGCSIKWRTTEANQ